MSGRFTQVLLYMSNIQSVIQEKCGYMHFNGKNKENRIKDMKASFEISYKASCNKIIELD